MSALSLLKELVFLRGKPHEHWSVSTKPTISAHPGPLVQVGENVTLRCHSLVWFDNFTLHQENSTGLSQRRGQMLTGGYAAADFIIGPMTLASVGTYRCYGSLRHSPYEWSAPSDPVDIIITGLLFPGLSKKPSLSAQGGPVVRSGENVTLVCSSESDFDQFHLLREGENLRRPLTGGWGPLGALQAEFPLGPGTPDHSGVYRCYGSFTHSPYSWSDSSDPLFLSVTDLLLKGFLVDTPSPPKQPSSSEVRSGMLIYQMHTRKYHLIALKGDPSVFISLVLSKQLHRTPQIVALLRRSMNSEVLKELTCSSKSIKIPGRDKSVSAPLKVI
ncbi:KIR2DL1 [Ovibos moschatus]